MNKPRNHAFGLAGTIIGMIAFCTAVFSPWIMEKIDPQPEIEEVAVEKAKSIWAKLKNEPVEEKTESKSSAASIFIPAVVGSGLLSIILGVVSYLKREDRRFSRVAIGSGLACIIAVFALIIAGAILLVILVAAILGGDIPI